MALNAARLSRGGNEAEGAINGAYYAAFSCSLEHSSMQVTQKYAHLTAEVLTATGEKTFGGQE